MAYPLFLQKNMQGASNVLAKFNAAWKSPSEAAPSLSIQHVKSQDGHQLDGQQGIRKVHSIKRTNQQHPITIQGRATEIK
jgi:hypothetical protein